VIRHGSVAVVGEPIFFCHEIVSLSKVHRRPPGGPAGEKAV